MQPVVKEPRPGHEHVLVESVLEQMKLTCLRLQFVTKEDVSTFVDEIGAIRIFNHHFFFILGLSRWTAWEGCIGSVCGQGTNRRERFCTDGPPGDNCDGAILIEDNVVCSYTCRKFQRVIFESDIFVTNCCNSI